MKGLMCTILAATFAWVMTGCSEAPPAPSTDAASPMDTHIPEPPEDTGIADTTHPDDTAPDSEPPPDAGQDTAADTGQDTARVDTTASDTADPHDTAPDSTPPSDTAGSTCESFATSVQPLLDAACVSCHEGANASLGLILTEGAAIDALVGVPSSYDPSLMMVVPGDPESSFLIDKLGPSPTHGLMMPMLAPALQDSEIALISDWITAGATAEPFNCTTGDAGTADVDEPEVIDAGPSDTGVSPDTQGADDVPSPVDTFKADSTPPTDTQAADTSPSVDTQTPVADTGPPAKPVDVIVGEGQPVSLEPPPPPAAPRARKRVNLDQLWATLNRVTGGVLWLDGAGQDLLIQNRALLGVPDFVNNTQETLDPDLLFDKKMGDMSRDVCVALMAKEAQSPPEERVFIVHADLQDTSASDAAAIAKNMRMLLVRFHSTYLPPESPQLGPWLALFDELAQKGAAANPIHAWTGICVALMSHPDFFTY